MDNKTGFTLNEVLPVVAKMIERAHRKCRQFISVKQIVPLMLEDPAGKRHVREALKGLKGNHTPECIASNMVA